MGIATEANLVWLVEHGYRYLVVRRGGARQFDEAQAVTIETANGDPIQLQKEMSEDGKKFDCIAIPRDGRRKPRW